MLAAERERILAELDRTREDLLCAVRPLSHKQLEQRVTEGRWSIAENIEHIIVAERGMLGLLQKALEHPEETSVRGDWDGKDDALRARLAQSRSERIEALEVIRPAGRWGAAELLPAFEQTRRRTRDFVEAATSEIRRRYFRHARFGLLDGYQWLILLVSHCDRHRSQIESAEAAAVAEDPL